MNRRIVLAAVSFLTVLTLGAQPAFAQAHAGVRAGVSVDPDQFFFGGHVETSPIASHVTFRPNAEIGIGDHVTLIALNFEGAYWFQNKRSSPWALYAGGGPAVNIYKVEGFGSDAAAGFNFLVGAQKSTGLFTEFKIGVGDSPTLKFTVGYSFK
jgi:hypothetical protein